MQNKPNVANIQNSISGLALKSELGEGGFKVVFKGEYKGNTEAIKIAHILDDPTDQGVKEENMKRLIREIKLLGACKSPYLVKLGTLAPTSISIDSRDYVVYGEELLSGDSVRSMIHAGHTPELEELVSLGICCIDAVQELWQHSTIHRDVKPDNIVATGDSARPYVMLDLGVAYIADGTPLTANQAAIPGTRYYLAPEMLTADFRDNLDFRADLYAIGLTIYEFATKSNPFMRLGEHPMNTIQRIASETPNPLSALRSDLPPEFCKVIDQLLKKRPHLRPNVNIVKKTLEACQ